MIRLVSSRKDEASKRISAECEQLGLEVTYIDESPIHAKELPEADAYIFLSKHSAKSGIPAFTAHWVGNFGTDTSVGGNAKELGYTYPSLMKGYILELNRLKHATSGLEKYQIVLEATHHGPTHFTKPVLFVEMGGTETEWKDEQAARLIAKAIECTLQKVGKRGFPEVAVAFGGTHYPQKFTDMLINSEYAIAHIFPKYQGENMSEEMFDQMIAKNIEPVKYVLVDWKGINQRGKIVDWAKNKGLEVIKI
jgi:D-aminoacyl-tRNA deacylase